MSDVDRSAASGVMPRTPDAGLLHGDAMTVTGRTSREPRRHRPAGPDGVIITRCRPIHPRRLTILRGSLARDGAVVQERRPPYEVFEGTARVFERTGRDGRRSPQGTLNRATCRHRYEGPRRPGIARCSPSAGAIRVPAWARTSFADRRPFSGGTTGPCIGHVAPERPSAPIPLVEEGDRIRLDLNARTLDLLVDAAERIAGGRLKPEPPQSPTGVLGKYAKLVGSCAQGAICGGFPYMWPTESTLSVERMVHQRNRCHSR